MAHAPCTLAVNTGRVDRYGGLRIHGEQRAADKYSLHRTSCSTVRSHVDVGLRLSRNFVNVYTICYRVNAHIPTLRGSVDIRP